MTILSEEKVRSLFNIADVAVLNLWELPNQYWPRPRFGEGRDDDAMEYARLREQSPWWLVKTPYGLIGIGWRKRVISIDWSDTDLSAPDLTADETTKGEHYIHAWSELKAVEYLTALGKALMARDVADMKKAVCGGPDLTLAR